MHKRSSLVFSLAAWTIATGIYMLVRFYGTAEVMDFSESPVAMVALWLISSLLLGFAYFGTDVIGNRPSMRSKSYGYMMVVRGLILIAAVLVGIFIARLIALAQGNLAAADLISAYLDRVTHKTTVAALVFVAVSSSVITFIRQMVERSGAKVIRNLISGKYHRPREETRIFLFLDLRSSTTMAEKLGHVLYSRLIQDCFRDLTECAIAHEVEIYQYVGDEAVLT